MRPSSSVPYARQSQLPGASAASAAKLIEKKKEYHAIAALERASTLFLERIEALAEDGDIMANAGEVHGQVLAQWPKMFEILNQFLTTKAATPAEGEQELATQQKQGQTLVRIPIEEVQTANNINTQ